MGLGVPVGKLVDVVDWAGEQVEVVEEVEVGDGILALESGEDWRVRRMVSDEVCYGVWEGTDCLLGELVKQ